MNSRKIHTPLTIGFFIVASITGVLMFFEIAPGSIRATHEWMSLLFVLAGVLHIFINKQPFVRYFNNKPLLVIAASIAVGGILFTISFDDIYLAEASFQLLTTIKIGELAPLLDISHFDLQSRLGAQGITGLTSGQSLFEIAQLYDMDVHDILEVLMEP